MSLASSPRKSHHNLSRVLVALISNSIEAEQDFCIVAEIQIFADPNQFLKYLGGKGLYPWCCCWEVIMFDQPNPSQTTI